MKESFSAGIATGFIISVICLVFIIYGGQPRGIQNQIIDTNSRFDQYIADKDTQLKAYEERLAELENRRIKAVTYK